MTFDADALLHAARRETGLNDFGSPDFTEALPVLVDALDREAEIADDRRDRLGRWLHRLLVNRLWFVKDLAEHPEILDEEIGTPIVITTLPRTGSTKLHRLLAASGDFQVLRFWQVHMPSRIPGAPGGGTKRRREATRDYERWMYDVSPGILTGHPMFTDEAEEDQWLMQATLRHPIFAGMFDVPSYLQWLLASDMASTFANFRQQLQYLQWQTGERGKPWLIKSPTHFGAESALEQVFGGIRAIVSHRDPAKCIPSIASTSKAVRLLYSDRDAPAGLGDAMLAMFSAAAQAHMSWREQGSAPILDLAFRDITGDGLGAAAAVYDFLGMDLSDQATAGMRGWEQANGREKHGSAVYSTEMYGLSDPRLHEAFAPYMARFKDYL